jgi:DNA-directed RNA polymerase subunit L
MLIININSQLGNQMFHFALYKKLLQSGKKVKFDTRYYIDHPQHYGLDIFNLKIPVATESEIKKAFDEKRDLLSRIKRKLFGKNQQLFSEIYSNTYCFKPDIFKFKSGYIDGYWQTEKYFSDIKPTLLNDFKFPAFNDEKNAQLLETMSKYYTVSIHVRRGDYLNGFPLMTPEYYEKAMAVFNREYKQVFYIVLSNDVEWSKNNIQFENGVYVDWNTGRESYKDMQLMTLCNSNIIANSSFSWWGAWLNPHPDKKVIAPSVWLNDIETPDIYCENWIII